MSGRRTASEYVVVRLSSLKNWLTTEKITGLLKLLNEAEPDHVPQRVKMLGGTRLKAPFQPEAFASIISAWMNSPAPPGLLGDRQRSPSSWITVEAQCRELERFNSVSFGTSARSLSDPDRISALLNLARDLSSWAETSHGFACHSREYEAENRIADESIAPYQLQRCLPGIFWANYFGPPYVEWFGRKTFVSCPAYHKEELGDGSWLLLSAASPLDWETPEARSMSQAIQQHLEGSWSFLQGAVFFDPRHPNRRYRTPKFQFEQASCGSSEPIIVDRAAEVFEEDPTGFLQSVPVLAEQLKESIRARATKLDYSPESLKALDSIILARSRRDDSPYCTEEGRLFLQQLTAYYGEVLRRNLGGMWLVAGPYHPAVRLGPPGQEVTENVFGAVWRLWLEREPDDHLADRYRLLQTGEWARLERVVNDLARGAEPPATD